MGELENEISKILEEEGIALVTYDIEARRHGAQSEGWLRVSTRVDFNYAVNGTGPIHDRYVRVLKLVEDNLMTALTSQSPYVRIWAQFVVERNKQLSNPN